MKFPQRGSSASCVAYALSASRASLSRRAARRLASAPVLGLALTLALAGCFGAPPRPASTQASVVPPESLAPPPPPDTVPDAMPRIEPRSRNGNPPFYEVFGKRYFVLSSSVGYVERGVASWYGPGFHKVRTSTGEPYDMYGMTAAHKTLPLPAYVRVTNLQNGRSVVVRVNDRGPFVGNRIIDLSYTAAAKLDMLRHGTALVEVRTIDPSLPDAATHPVTAAATEIPTPVAPIPAGSPAAANSMASTGSTAAMNSMSASAAATAATAGAPAAGSSTAPSVVAATQLQPASGVSTVPVNSLTLFVQAGAFSDPANAERLAAKLRGGGYGKIFVRDNEIAGRRMYRVRVGPVPNVAEFDRIVAALERAGISDAHLALD